MRLCRVQVGETGTGKTLNVANKLLNDMPDEVMPVFMTFSARTSANQTQDIIDSKMDKRRKVRRRGLHGNAWDGLGVWAAGHPPLSHEARAARLRLHATAGSRYSSGCGSRGEASGGSCPGHTQGGYQPQPATHPA